MSEHVTVTKYRARKFWIWYCIAFMCVAMFFMGTNLVTGRYLLVVIHLAAFCVFTLMLAYRLHMLTFTITDRCEEGGGGDADSQH